MGIASMVLGIIAALVCWIPFCNYWAIIPAIVGLVLGSVDMKSKKQKQQPHGMAIAGVVLNIVALVVIGIWTVVIGGASARAVKDINQAQEKFAEDYKASQEKVRKDMEKAQEQVRKDLEKAQRDIEKTLNQ